jgi:hypothetical protein
LAILADGAIFAAICEPIKQGHGNAATVYDRESRGYRSQASGWNQGQNGPALACIG